MQMTTVMTVANNATQDAYIFYVAVSIQWQVHFLFFIFWWFNWYYH
jgi:hypothetical protein